MSLVDLLLNLKNITFDWERDPNLRLVVDLDRSSFCGVPVGGPLRELSVLGPADDPRTQGGILPYLSRGFYLIHDETRSGRMRGVVLHTAPPAQFQRRHGGRDVAIDITTTREDLRRILGEPFHEYLDPVSNELVWYYEPPHAEWQFQWSAIGSLESIEIIAWRELDDAGSRASYGCTKAISDAI